MVGERWEEEEEGVAGRDAGVFGDLLVREVEGD